MPKEPVSKKDETIIVPAQSHPAPDLPLRNWGVLQTDNNLPQRQHQGRDLTSISNDSRENDDWPRRVQTTAQDSKILQ